MEIMIYLISPAKSLDLTDSKASYAKQQPKFMNEAAELVSILKALSVTDIKKLMKISEDLAQLNSGRFHSWSKTAAAEEFKTAISTFNGDVYEGLSVNTLDPASREYLEEHTRILSGLYGILTPSDALQPYRLEMGTPLKNRCGSNLYAYWREKITMNLIELLEETKSALIVNLASEEYFKAVDTKKISTPIITPIFEDKKNGNYKIISFYAKRARGLMLRYACENKVRDVSDLTKFDYAGYRFIAEKSDGHKLVFRRDPSVLENLKGE